MVDITEMRKRFYEEDDDADPYGLGLGTGSSSTAGTGTGAGAGAGASSSSSSSGPHASTNANARRPGPYPRRTTTTTAGSSSSTNARGGGKDSKRARGAEGSSASSSSFMERMRAAGDDDDPSSSSSNFPTSGAGSGAMDVDASALDASAILSRHRTHRPDSESDVTQLLRAWQNERHAPDVLPSADALLVRVLDAIRRQSEDASALRSTAHLSEEEHYMTTLVQTEVERVKFVVRSYVRTRLAKIEAYAAHITSQPDVQARLTAAELRHAQRYAALTVSQFQHTVLSHLPEAQQALDDEVITIPNMITEPNKDKPVFCHTFETLPNLMLRDGSSIEVARDSIIMVPYRSIEQLLLRGEVELV